MGVVDVISAVLMLVGGLSCLLGALGLVRLPDLPARLQATTKPQTLGLLLILLGVAVNLEFESSSTLVLVVLFQVLTAPVISQVVGRSAYRTGAIDRTTLVVDDLGDTLDADARAVESATSDQPARSTPPSSSGGDAAAPSGGASSRSVDGVDGASDR